MSLFSKLAAAGVLVVGLTVSVGSGVAAAEDCARADYCNPDTPDVGDRDDECIPDADNVDSDGPGGTDDEVRCDDGPEQCIPDDDAVDSDGPGGTDDEVACDEGSVRPGGAEVCVYDEDTVDSDGAGAADDEVLCAEPAGQTTTGGAAGAEAEAAALGAQQAPSGSLPITGGDVVGMAIIGAGAIALGTVLVRRSKKPGVY